MEKFKCLDCNTIQLLTEMKHEYDFDYNQFCCYNCNSVLIDDIYGIVYAEKIGKNILKDNDDIINSYFSDN